MKKTYEGPLTFVKYMNAPVLMCVMSCINILCNKTSFTQALRTVYREWDVFFLASCVQEAHSCQSECSRCKDTAARQAGRCGWEASKTQQKKTECSWYLGLRALCEQGLRQSNELNGLSVQRNVLTISHVTQCTMLCCLSVLFKMNGTSIC